MIGIRVLPSLSKRLQVVELIRCESCGESLTSRGTGKEGGWERWLLGGFTGGSL